LLLTATGCQGLIEKDGDWLCGYAGKLDAQGQCVDIDKVENGWFDGKQWHCNQGFIKQGELCVETKEIGNAWFDGSEWHCNSGFVKQAEECLKVTERDNAWFDGKQWVCNGGFMEREDECIPDPNYDPNDHTYPEE